MNIKKKCFKGKFTRKMKVLDEKIHLIMRNLEREEFRNMSLKAQVADLASQDECFERVNAQRYRRFLIEHKLAKYQRFVKVSPQESTLKNQAARLIVARILLELQLAEALILYFDTTVVQDYSFKTKNWGTSQSKNVIHANSQMKSIKVYAMLTQNQLVSVQFLKKPSSAQLHAFIQQSVTYAMRKFRASEAWIFLDNATVHRSAEFMEMIESLNVRMIFNAVSNPQFNIVEYFFEYVKRDLRTTMEMPPYSIIGKMIERAKKIAIAGTSLMADRQHKAFQRLVMTAASQTEQPADSNR